MQNSDRVRKMKVCMFRTLQQQQMWAWFLCTYRTSRQSSSVAIPNSVSMALSTPPKWMGSLRLKKSTPMMPYM